MVEMGENGHIFFLFSFSRSLTLTLCRIIGTHTAAAEAVAFDACRGANECMDSNTCHQFIYHT